MKFEAVTIKDIAKALGISTSTVSRALRDSYEISTETKQLVLECAERLNYKPNPVALGLKERRTRSIGIIVCEIANPFFSQVINGIESIAYDKGYNVIITQSHESYEREVEALQFLSSRSIDGLLVSASTETNDFSHFKELSDKGLPIVFFDRITNAINTHTVMLDNFKAAYLATEHLIQNGYTRIGAIANSEFLSITNERMAGYYEALQHHNIVPDEGLVSHCFYSGLDASEIDDAINKFFASKKRPDAIVCFSDKLTIGALSSLKRRGIKVPDEIAMAGFLNYTFAELLDPPLSVIVQPALEMGRDATELLLQLIESKRPIQTFEKRLLAPQLIVRSSSLPKKKS
ncbi:MAG TPA: LacI family DNA-binding transcriptional regulator [Phnomibacter sp.]|nr:LacI family DNA-binding transcriptional regulator [Phnomibacter sp.]